MPRMNPLPTEDLAELGDIVEQLGTDFHELPRSLSTIARRPEIARQLFGLWRAVMHEGEIPLTLKWLVGYMASRAHGCMYCSAHTATGANGSGADADKIDAIWEYENSSLFSEAERAALRFAQSAGSVPNAVTDADFDDMRAHYSESQIVEILSVVAMYGFWNRWNDSIATELEATPKDFSEQHLAGQGWQIGEHGA